MNKMAVWFYIILMLVVPVESQSMMKRSRGERLYRCENANTVGRGNMWCHFTTLGFLWDSSPEKGNRPAPFAFPELYAAWGIFNYVTLDIETRLVTYGWEYAGGSVGLKCTLFPNKDIRFHTVGIKTAYTHAIPENIHTSIAGYRNMAGTGFTPEGFIVQGGNLSVTALYDIDFLAKQSWLPLKISTNLGIKIPMDTEFITYSQYCVNVGIAYIGLAADVFVEYTLEAFVGKPSEPKIFRCAWPGWQVQTNDVLEYRVWEVAFTENPMYVVIGGRIRYPGGIAILGAVPLLLSRNSGSAMTKEDKLKLKQGKFPEETARGITDPFDPWYAKWKIVVQVSFPIRFKQTGVEMRRNFLLLKNKKDKKKIDIEQRLEDETGEEKEDREKRLDEINKRLKSIMQEE